MRTLDRTNTVNIQVHLRNKFHFSEVHQNMKAMGHVQSKWQPSMNAVGQVQSKWRPLCVTLTLHRSPLWSYLMNPRKIKFISYIYPLFLHRFCLLFVKFRFKFCKTNGEEKLQTEMFGFYIQQPSSWHGVSRMLRQPVNYFIYLWHRLKSHEQVLFIGVWTSSVQIRFI